MIFPNTSRRELWPFGITELPDIIQTIRGFSHLYSASIMNEVYFFPIIWMLALWFWEQLQIKKRGPEAFFRAALIPIALFLLPQAIYLFATEKAYSKEFTISCFAAIGACAFIFN